MHAEIPTPRLRNSALLAHVILRAGQLKSGDVIKVSGAESPLGQKDRSTGILREIVGPRTAKIALSHLHLT